MSEEKRLLELRELDILDTPAESMFDDITQLAASICNVSVAAISLIDSDRQWLKSRVGTDLVDTPRDVSFCHHAIQQSDFFEVPNAAEDARFVNNPLVTGAPNIRFYASTPLTLRTGTHPGTLCVIDYEPRTLNEAQVLALKVLAGQVSHLLELRRLSIQQKREATFAKAMVKHTAAGLIATNLDGTVTHCNPAAAKMLGYPPESLVNNVTPAAWHTDDEVVARAKALSEQYDELVEPGFGVFTFEADRGEASTHRWTFQRADGDSFFAQLSVEALRDNRDEHIGYLGMFTDASESVKFEKALEESLAKFEEAAAHAESRRMLLAQIHDILATFISQPSTSKAFDEILHLLLDSTSSEYGFIGEVLYEDDGTPYLKTHAITNIAWNQETRDFYNEHAPQGLVFTNLRTLFGRVMTTHEMVIANSPYTDPRRGGLPDGHPPLVAFLGIPISSGDKLVGMVGVANRPGGYDKSVADNVQPLLATYGHLIEARQDRARREEAERSLQAKSESLARIFEASGLASWLWNLDTDVIRLGGAWQQIPQTAPCDNPMPRTDWIARIHPEDRDHVDDAMQAQAKGEAPFPIVEFRMRTADGRWRWLHAESAITDSNDAGQPSAISGTCKDIHDRHTVEAQARQLAAHQTMMQEVHHRVKNNLQIVSSLLSFQQARAEDEAVARGFELTRNRVAAIASLHETLYRSDAHRKVRVGALLEGLIGDIRHSYGLPMSRLVLDTQQHDSEIPADMAGPCALIVNEWVTNAIKHAFPDRPVGEILVRLGAGADDNTVEVEVCDDGAGMTPIEQRRAGSLGLKIVGRLALQLGGSAEQISAERGTRWRLRFRVKS